MIAVFTKYDQFRRDVKMKLAYRSGRNPSVGDVNDEAAKIFQEQYLDVIKGSSPRYVRLESKVQCYISHFMIYTFYLAEMHKVGESCSVLIMETASALSLEVVTLMLLAVQRGNLEMSVKMAVKRYVIFEMTWMDKNFIGFRANIDDDRMTMFKSSIEYLPHLWVCFTV